MRLNIRYNYFISVKSIKGLNLATALVRRTRETYKGRGRLWVTDQLISAEGDPINKTSTGDMGGRLP